MKVVPAPGAGRLLRGIAIAITLHGIGMTNRIRAAAAAALLFAAAPAACAQTSPPPPAAPTHRETAVTTRASGTFDVKLDPQATDAPGLSRYSLDKTFHGDLEGTSKGEMLANGNATGSGVYVAIEVVTGTLHGRSGSFALYHSGVMNRGTPTLSVSVVPDSGTGELAGISGTLNIIIEGGKHSYELDYTLPGS